MIEVPFVGSQAEGRGSNVNCQRTVNLYPEATNDGKAIKVLYSTPGLKYLFTKGAGPTRSNGTVFKEKGYFVSGGELIEIDKSGGSLSVGTLDTVSGRCGIVSGNNNYLMVVDGQDGYTYDGTTFAKIVDADFPTNCTHVSYLANKFITIDSETGKFFVSGDDDPTSWDPLDFTTAESHPDNTKAIISTNDVLWVVGHYSTEPYTASDNADFPFDRMQGGYSNWGIHAPFSLAEGDGEMFFLAHTERGGIEVVRSRGAQVQEISTPEISWQINNLGNISDAIGFVYRQRGHSFYILTFPSGNKTLCFDMSLPIELAWTERTTWLNDIENRWRPNGHLYFNSKQYVGDYVNGNFYELDFDTFTDDSEVIRRVRRTKVITDKKKRIKWGALEVDFKVGVGLISGQGIDPKAMLRYSVDGCETWSDELWQGMGALGKYLHRARWVKLGSSYDRVYELVITDPINVTITNVYAQAS